MDIDIQGAGQQIVQKATSVGTIKVVLIIFLVILVFIATGVITYFILKKKKFNKFVVVFEKINGKPEVVLRCRAMISKFGRGGDQIMILAKGKKILPKPEIQTGRNNYWFYIREDGEWINIGISDIDEKFREVNANFLHPEIRYQRTSIQEGMIKERYQQTSWWKENWHIIVSIAVIVVLLIFMFLIVSKQIQVMNAQQGVAETVKETVEIANKLLASAENLRSGGSGLVSVG